MRMALYRPWKRWPLLFLLVVQESPIACMTALAHEDIGMEDEAVSLLNLFQILFELVIVFPAEEDLLLFVPPCR